MKSLESGNTYYCYKLIKQLSSDAKLLKEKPTKIKELLHKYIVKIEVNDTTITLMQ